MVRSFYARQAVLAAVLGILSAVPGVRADDNADMQAKIDALNARIAELEKKEGENWMTQARADQIKQIVTDTIADAKAHGGLDNGMGLNAGYKNGFYIQTDDQNFSLKVNGFFQYRYTFAQDTLHNSSSFPASQSKGGNVNGFDFRYARITFDGNAFSKNITYLFTGDFASDGSNVNDFQLVDGFIAYRFNDMVNVRAGAFITPYSRIVYISSGLQLVDWPTLFNPFNPDRSTGLSLYGDIIKDKLAYEVNMNNGERSNHIGRADDTSATGSVDNRLAFYGRTQWAGAGNISEFADESDLRKDNSQFIWLLGAGGGYESQNATTDAFPHAQTSTALIGLSSANSPGFLGTQNLNGDLFRGTVDWSGKWQGWGFTTAGFFQEINQNPGTFATTGSTTVGGAKVATSGTTTTIPGYGSADGSFFQAGYYGQAGYMLIPQRLEAVGRVGQLLTEGYPNRMEEYSVGLNYYLFGKNVKIQSDLTYIPNEAAYSSTTYSTVINTQDIIARVQLQLKF